MDDSRARERARFVESVGIHFERLGLSRTAGRVLGHLFVEERGSADAGELCAALGTAKSTVSVSLRQLERVKLVERYRQPGGRRDRYRVVDDVFGHALKAKMAELGEFDSVVAQGLRVVEGDSAAARRLRTMIDMNTFLREEFAKLLEQWEVREHG